MSAEDETVVDRQEFIAMASRASDEIKALRGQIAFLAPKAQAYDALVVVLGMIPARPQTMGEDLAGLLDRRVHFLKDADKPKPPPPGAKGVKSPVSDDEAEGVEHA
ncbi:hypothetical protein [Neorhizobium sp. NCHU2750]|uniref:hypothetical protein n=1 Tax=Neorhizobium sp. NCHU2750 TaxID=1825976 RepID=UPI000E7586B1|nr:hypothetical protein NCHU2750_28240 [Neorhizobium sp. NCHU2750]